MKHNFTKRLALLVALLVLLCSAFAGCGGDPTGSATTAATDNDQDILQATEAVDATEEASANWLDSVYDPEAGEGKFSIYFINATKDYVTDSSVTHAGDSTLLVSPDGVTMLIDFNNAANGSEIVASLQRLGIETLDYVVLSHPHADHIGSYATVMRYIEIKEVIKNAHDYSASSATYAAMMDAFEDAGVKITEVTEGDTFKFGDSVDVEILNPPVGYGYDDSTAAGNNGSVLMRFTYGESSYLTGGDLYAEQEKILVEKLGDKLKTDVVKINHHGYDTSSTREWVNAVSCKIAVCEANGVNSDVVEGRYRLSGATTLYTCLDGTVVVRTTGDGTYEVQVEQERYITIYGILTDREGYQNGRFTLK